MNQGQHDLIERIIAQHRFEQVRWYEKPQGVIVEVYEARANGGNRSNGILLVTPDCRVEHDRSIR